MKFQKSFGGREKYKSMKFKKDITSDCVARAVSIALGQDYKTTFVELAMLSAKLLEVPNSKRCYEVYLKEKGWKVHKPMRNGNNKLSKVSQFPTSGTFLVSISRHLTCIKDGVIYDVWDTSRHSAYSYYTKEDK